MKYWVLTDTHFGHDKVREYCGRPDNSDDLLLRGIQTSVGDGDTLIHLGDVCIGNDVAWHERLFNSLSPTSRAWLVRGNHDRKSVAWYIDHGWHFVADSFALEMFGHSILFSHVPRADNGYTLNIHGHFHNSDHRRHEPELVAIKNSKQVLVAVEWTDYRPVELKTIVQKWCAKTKAKERSHSVQHGPCSSPDGTLPAATST